MVSYLRGRRCSWHGLPLPSICASLLFSLDANSAPKGTGLPLPEPGSYSGAVVACSSNYYSPETDSAVEARYAITLYDTKVAGNGALTDTHILKQKSQCNSLVIDILKQQGVSDRFADYDLECEEPLYTVVNTAQMQDEELQVDSIQYRDSSIYYMITADRGNGDFQYLTRKKRNSEEFEPVDSGAMSNVLGWSRSAKLTLMATVGAVILIVVGPGVLAVIPGGALGASALTVFGSLTTFKTRWLREWVAGIPAFLIAGLDSLVKQLGAVEPKQQK